MMPSRFRFAPVALACCCAGAAWSQGAPAAAAAADVDTVVVTGSPRAQRLLDTPYAITAVDAAALRDAGPMINLSEALARVPGLVVNNRSNYAQDLQMSSRGFGARAAFGVRGLRLYTDGIPATMPDGQGQVAHFDLSGAERIEVLRGPFSVLYGNSSGGVVAVFTAPVRAAHSEVGVDLGSFGLHQLRLGLATPLGQGFDLRASITRAELDGFRPQSAAERQLANARLAWRGERDSVVLLMSNHDQRAQDPLGLSPAQFALDARMTTPQALEYNTRKTIRQTQLGVNWRHVFDASGALRASSLTAYAGTRGVTGWQSIPATVQTSATHGGGVVDFDRSYQGLDAKLEWRLGGGDLVTGITAEGQRDDRRGHRNYTGPASAPTAKGVVGELRRQEINRADSREAYAQLHWPIRPALALTGGLRSGEVTMRTDDAFLANGNDSGQLRYRYTNPVAGLRWTLTPGWALHASAARGFESPTLGELAYAPSTQTEGGFNRGLSGQTSRQYELGSKWRGATASAELALFSAATDNEIGVLSNTGGRSVFQNVGSTRRQGAELSAAWRPQAGLRLQLAASWLQAEYRNSIGSAVAGKRISGTAGASGWAEAAWRPGVLPGELALEWRAMGRMAANDANTVYAPGHALVHLRWSHTLALGQADALELLARVDNLFDRRYVGSVIVNDGNGRFFETGVPRAVLLSARWQHRW